MTGKAGLKKRSAGTKKTLILGVGNTIRGDDAAGILAARALEEKLDSSLRDKVDIRQMEDSGVNMLELLPGYKKAVIIDSISTKEAKPGKIHKLKKSSFSRKIAKYSTHQFGIPAFLEMAGGLKLDMPQVVIYAVEIEPKDEFSCEVTPLIKKSIDRLASLAMKEIIR